MYKDKKFRVRKIEDIKHDISLAKKYYGEGLKRVFLCDGDATVLKTDILLDIIGELNREFPNLEHIASYVGPQSILHKTPEELKKLRAAGLDRLFLGVETGDDELLRKIKKGVTADEMAKAGSAIVDAGFDLCCMVIVGLAGSGEGSRAHALASAEIINRINPKMLAALTLTPVRGTELYDEIAAGNFELIDSFETLQELKWIIENCDVDNMKFAADHASNYLPLKGYLQKDKKALVALLDETLNSGDRRRLKSEYLRGL